MPVEIREQSIDPRDRKGARPGVVVRRTAAALAFVAVVSAPASALETDQYYAWGRPFAGATVMVNARFNLELERAIAGFPRRPATDELSQDRRRVPGAPGHRQAGPLRVVGLDLLRRLQ